MSRLRCFADAPVIDFMSGLCPAMKWGCGGTQRERSDRAVLPRSYQGSANILLGSRFTFGVRSVFKADAGHSTPILHLIALDPIHRCSETAFH